MGAVGCHWERDDTANFATGQFPLGPVPEPALLSIDEPLAHYTQRNLFGILLNPTEIRLHLPVSDRFGTKRTSV